MNVVEPLYTYFFLFHLVLVGSVRQIALYLFILCSREDIITIIIIITLVIKKMSGQMPEYKAAATKMLSFHLARNDGVSLQTAGYFSNVVCSLHLHSGSARRR